MALSLAALQIGTLTRAQRLAAANTLEQARARAAAEGGIEHARAKLRTKVIERTRTGGGNGLRSFESWEWLNDIMADTGVLGDHSYRVTMSDMAARLDINRVDEEGLKQFLRALRVDFGEADRIAQAAMDWRDEDDLHRARGAEREDYLREHLPVLPANGPFEDASEFRHVRGMTPEIWARVRQHLTVTGSGLINVNSAPDPVLLSLPGMTPAGVEAVMRRRRQGRPLRTVQELADELPPIARQWFLPVIPAFLRRATFDLREIEVVSEGWVDGSPIRVRVIALMIPAGQGVHVAWRRFE
jgi:general secretion pathway protein K